MKHFIKGSNESNVRGAFETFKLKTVNKVLETPDPLFNRLDISWLKSASKAYNISADINDYVIVPVPLITSDIPNRNSQCFSKKDLVTFNVVDGRLAYNTFVGKPTFYNHDNKNPLMAKGVNLDATLIHIPKYNVVKVMVLSAFDRTKDSVLTNKILKKEINSYSMGAVASYFICSVCAGELGPSIKNRTCMCIGTDYKDISSLGKIRNGKVHYHLAKDFTFIENSAVDSPADISAVTNDFI